MKEFEHVKSKTKIGNIPANTYGIIVEKYNENNFIAEFFDDDGDTIDVVDVNINDVVPIEIKN